MEHGGCYIFLSHASANIDIVRRIRNEFESLGQNPIAFYLRCLDENYKGRDEELWNLIYREIDAREWFVYCQSPEAEESKNVQKECAYIKQAGKDKMWDIDITADWEIIRNRIHKIVADLEVFISYSREDKAVADVLKKVLVDADYSVWDPEYDMKTSGTAFMDQIGDAILRCAYKGFYVLIISENSIRNKYVEKELEFATGQGALIVPVVVGNPDIPEWMILWLGQCYKCSENPSEEDFASLLKGIDRVMLKKIQNMNAQADS